jgi:molybdate transport system substrate-binding protein
VELKAKSTQTPPGTLSGRWSLGEAEIGFRQMSELLPFSAGIDIVDPCRHVQVITVFSGGVHVTARQPGAAKQLVKFLTSPAAAPVIRKKGMQPAGAGL